MHKTISTTSRAAVLTAAAALTVGVLSLQPASAEDAPSPSAPAPSVPAATPTTPTTQGTTPAPTPSATTVPTATAPTATATPKPTATAKPFVPLRKGDRSKRVRDLQSRLHQLGLHSEIITSTFDVETKAGVVALQRKHKVKQTRGVVGQATWNVLTSLTRTPTANELNNVYKPGKTLLKVGSKSKKVRDLEARLKQVTLFTGKVGAVYDKKTRKAVRKFQKKVRIPITGKVDARTLERLADRTRKPNKTEMYNLSVKGTKLDERCKTGRVMCIDKSSRTLRWVVNGVVKTKLDARFGGSSTPTREGQFKVFMKSRDHVSSLYNSYMPFAMFFSGGQAVHYSPDFAQTGYNGASHGCVNIRDRKAIEKLFNKVKVGDKVVVYRS